MRFLPFLFLFLVSCSDNFLYNEATPHIFIEILNRSDTIPVGGKINFQAIISHVSEDMEISWIIGKENSSNYQYYTNLKFEKTFNESGLYKIKFLAKDSFYDKYEDSLFIRVSNVPDCDSDNMSLDIVFQGSPTFKWNCTDRDDNGSLIYKFLLLSTYGKDEFLRMDTTLTKNSLQLGYALQKDDAARLIVTNKYGLQTHLKWNLP